ncbi:hypothetical protein NQ318_008894 [Aromia moschata]|uniref:Fe2OG dioxygenase domain-containing protein n=1 Tax=Aromia moschata TaxID=1265417 RepID=A0AAV8ZBI1_9CUCU|nr:hypothetical protein NQ318_008894 [Aromia moschata]
MYKSKFVSDVLVFTVATEAKEGYIRYLDSAKELGINPVVLGFGQAWKAGKDIYRKSGGGWKINLLKEALIPYRDETDKIVLFTDAYDVIFVNNLNEILQKFQKTNARVLFGAEPFCWPDPELAPKYPEVKEGKRFLNSGTYMGYVPEILKLLEREAVEDTADDQLYFTKGYLDEDFRNEIQMKLDHKSEIFQNIYGVEMDLELYSEENKTGGPERYYAQYHSGHVKNFTEKYGTEYLSVKQITPEDGTAEWRARDLSLDQCMAKNCDVYFSVDSIAAITNNQTLRLLIEQNRTFVGPMLTRTGRAWSNFWGAISKDGFYARSDDYLDIAHNVKRGLWNVPYIGSCYLINATLLKRYDRKVLNFNSLHLDPDMAFCSKLRELDVYMYVSNRVDFGHLINYDTYDTTKTEPDMYQIFDNQKEWEERYIHKDYRSHLLPESVPQQPCPDVFWYPVGSEKFTKALINMMETYGKWSSGKNEDDRLEGGYEAVPTRDIHMRQVDYDSHWHYFLKEYVLPLQLKSFHGYSNHTPYAKPNFVVRYRPDEQAFLKPHHDTSTYTINIALNQVGVDYEGGGCRFIRYNCSVVDTKPGWILIHPGKLTHYHEGLHVTKGTRYIVVSFVDP